jgi:5-keto-L-gluconate epimerase
MFRTAFSLSPLITGFGPMLFSGDLNRGLKVASELGYNGVELSIKNPLDLDKEDIIKRTESLGLDIYAIATGQSYYNDGYSFSAEDKNTRNSAIKRIKDNIDFAEILNCKIIIGGILGNIREKFGSGSDVEKRVIDSFYPCLDYAKMKNVTILFEPINRYETLFINTMEEGREFLNVFNYDNLKLIPDTFHMNIEESSLENSLRDNIDFIGYIHLVDSNRRAPGFGHTDFKSIIKTLTELNYSGVLSCEILPLPDSLTAANQAIKYLKNELNI